MESEKFFFRGSCLLEVVTGSVKKVKDHVLSPRGTVLLVAFSFWGVKIMEEMEILLMLSCTN